MHIIHTRGEYLWLMTSHAQGVPHARIYIFCRLTEELDGKYAPVYAVCVGRWQSSHVRVRKVLDGSRDERLFKVVARGW